MLTSYIILSYMASAWLDKVCAWDFKKVVPAHFDAPIAATPYKIILTTLT